jgi:primosomal protein N' (replication factor Y)
LDFSHVSLVGVLNADQLMNYPDFRSFERSFQLMSQVAGRAGRRDVQGEVVIQTFHPDHFVIQCVVEHDYKKLYTGEIADRMQFHYPPFYRLIRLIIKSKDYVLLDNAAMYLSSKLKERLADRVLGPEAPPVGKVRDEYLRQFMIKLERDIHPKPVKLFIQNELLLMKSHKDFKSIKTVVDVDPM